MPLDDMGHHAGLDSWASLFPDVWSHFKFALVVFAAILCWVFCVIPIRVAPWWCSWRVHFWWTWAPPRMNVGNPSMLLNSQDFNWGNKLFTQQAPPLFQSLYISDQMLSSLGFTGFTGRPKTAVGCIPLNPQAISLGDSRPCILRIPVNPVNPLELGIRRRLTTTQIVEARTESFLAQPRSSGKPQPRIRVAAFQPSDSPVEVNSSRDNRSFAPQVHRLQMDRFARQRRSLTDMTPPRSGFVDHLPWWPGAERDGSLLQVAI